LATAPIASTVRYTALAPDRFKGFWRGYEVRNEAEYFADIPEVKIPKEMLDLAEHILESKATDFDPPASRITTRQR
jgi:hypothetical protein